MLISIDYEETFTISESSMEKAVLRIDRLLKGFREFVNEEVTFNRYQATRKRVKDFITARGEVKTKELLQGLKMPTKDLQVVLNTLLEEETLHVRQEKSGNNKVTNLYSINGKQ
jgi:transcription initiation factor IIE alpha subunit